MSLGTQLSPLECFKKRKQILALMFLLLSKTAFNFTFQMIPLSSVHMAWIETFSPPLENHFGFLQNMGLYFQPFL